MINMVGNLDNNESRSEVELSVFTVRVRSVLVRFFTVGKM